MTKVKVSLYEDGTGAAWVIFDKQPGSNDNWFQPSRIIESYPRDTELLKSSSEMSLDPQENYGETRFYILESNPDFNLKIWSLHAYWMKIFEAGHTFGFLNGACEYGDHYIHPYILHSKGSNPTLLSKSNVSLIEKWDSSPGTNNLDWSEAEHFCETHLPVPIATMDDVDNTRINQPYQCCRQVGMRKIHFLQTPIFR